MYMHYSGIAASLVAANLYEAPPSGTAHIPYFGSLETSIGEAPLCMASQL